MGLIDRLLPARAQGAAADEAPAAPRGASAVWRAVTRLSPVDAARHVDPVATLGAAIPLVPLLLVLLAKELSADLGRGSIVASPWSLLSPSWGAWSLTGLLIVAVAALVMWARRGLAAPELSRAITFALIGLVAFAGWCAAATFLWSDSPSGSWRWTIVGACALVASGLGLMVGSETAGRRGLVVGLLLSGTLLALIGLAELLGWPGANRRLLTPLDPTAGGLLIAIGALAALGLDQQVHPQQRRWLRGAATLCLIAVVLSASRGAVGVLLIGVLLLAVRGAPVTWPALQAAAGAAPAVATALLSSGVVREGGGDTTSRLIVGGLAIAGVGLVAWSAARDVGAPAGLARWARSARGQGALAMVLVGLTLGLLSLGSGGLPEAWNRTSDAFAKRSTPGVPADASRLWDGTSDGRLWRWQAALDAYQQAGDPLRGLGPGTSAQVLRTYRRDGTPALTIPSAPVALLTEGGIVGLLFAVTGVAGLSFAARTRRREEPISDGSLLLTIGSVVLLHALVNDSHLQPLVLIPAFAAVAGVAARPSLERRLAPAASRNSPPGIRTVAAGFGALAAVVIALGALAPARAQVKARGAEAALARGDAASVTEAALLAGQATRLDPLGYQGEAIEAQAALAQQRWIEARRLALDAVRHAPREASAWRSLALVMLAEHDRPGARLAVRRLLALDPASPATQRLALEATLDSAPPEGSPTAIATPLTATSD